MKFLIAAAGTGGHVFPALEFGHECIKNDHEIFWIGTKTGIENRVIPHDTQLFTIPMKGFRGKNIFHKIFSILGLVVSILKSISYIKKNNINYVVCFGGYISLPVGLAAWICRKPLFLHEQNSIIGTSNRILQKFAEILFLGFSINRHVFQNTMLVGNPIKNFNKNFIPNPKKDTLRIYVTGGSQGSDFINRNIPIVLNDLELPIEIKHQCGKGKSSGIKELYSAKISVEVKEFYDSPQDLILWSDFIVSRAGALSLSEAISLKKGLVMIPLPSATDNHQLFNANQIKSLEMGLVHEEHESIESLSKKIKNLIETKQYLEWSDKDCNIDHFQAARRMVSSIIKF